MNKRYIDFVPTGQKKTVKTASTVKSGTTGAAKASAAPYRAMPQSGAGVARQRVATHTRSRIQAGTRANQAGAQKAQAGIRAAQAKAQATRSAQAATRAARPVQLAQPKAAATASSVVYESRTVQYGPSGLSIDEEQTLGVIENLNEKFVSKDVEKRPLSDGKPLPEKDLAKEAKSKRLLGRKHKNEAAKQPVENPVEKPAETEKKKTYTVPKSPFINQEKVVKRPLSKNVYAKKAEPSREEHGPVTIIAKPEKDSRVGIVVAVILIIILGAAAGTVAFLLLPK